MPIFLSLKSFLFNLAKNKQIQDFNTSIQCETCFGDKKKFISPTILSNLEKIGECKG